MEKKLIFPANILLESENEDALLDEIRRHAGAALQGHMILRMGLEEEEFLRFLCGEMRHIGMSRGVIRGGDMQVTEGPLKGMESQICKIDRHKRLAKLRASKRQNIRYIPAGLEIIEKTI